jgi:prepilin peptidase CpaA
VTLVSTAALVTAAVACVTDVAWRRIPNWLTFGATGLAVLTALGLGGWRTAGWSIAGWAVGLLLFLPLFALRGLGGGDVKLLAALGAWVGPASVVWVALYAALLGGPLALVIALVRGYGFTAFRNVWSLLTFWRVSGLQPHPTIRLDVPHGPRVPYALPIAAGLMVSLWLQ